MTTYNPGSGFTGTPDPAAWATNQAAIANLRTAAAGASLLLWPEAGQMGAFVDPLDGDGLIYEKLADYAATTRASKAWHPNWDFVSGSVVGPLVELANNAPVIGPGGLLVAGQVENLIANPRGEGAAAPATPTGWSFGAGAGGTWTVVAKGTQEGWPYVDLKYHGTSTTAGFLVFGSPAATNSQTWTGSLGIRMMSGSASKSPRLLLTRDAGGIVGQMTAAVDRSHRRFTLTATTPAPGTTVTIINWALFIDAGTYDNAVFRVFAPSLTLTAYPVPPVLPPVGSTGATVKQADLCTMPTSGWYRSDVGTVVVEFIQPPLRPDNPNGGNGLGLFRLENANTHEHRGLQLVETTGVLQGFARAVASGTIYTQTPGAALAPGARGLAALMWNAAGAKAALNGAVSAQFGAGVTVPAATLLRVGAGSVGGSFGTLGSQAPIERLRYFPRALSDSELASVTTPYWSN